MTEQLLEDYIKDKLKEIKNLENEIKKLDKINRNNPNLIFYNYEGNFSFYSRDYTLAKDFKIKIRNKIDSTHSCSGPDGGISATIKETYPQFYFKIDIEDKKVPVLIYHDNFDEDEKIVIKRERIRQAHGYAYAGEGGYHEEYIDTNKVISFFKRKGVKESLIEKLTKQISGEEEF